VLKKELKCPRAWASEMDGHADHQIRRKNAHSAECPRSALRGAVSEVDIGVLPVCVIDDTL
jgi:hypothetical protein